MNALAFTHRFPSRHIVTLLICAALWTSIGARADDSANPPDFSAAALSVATESDAPSSLAQELVLRALSFIGVRYKWGGFRPDTGFDCSGLVVYVYQQITGRLLPRTTYDMARAGETIDSAELKPGDLVFFNTLRRPYSHVGIYLGDSRFIHAPSRGGKVEIVSMENRYWQSRFNGARRLPI
jgi:cell wall-associated NlpC family hydrolase